jgi:hypothetical protein
VSASIGNLNVLKIVSDSIYVSNVTVSNILGVNSTIQNIKNTNSSIESLISNVATIGSLVITDNIPSYNSSTGAFTINGGISINETLNATSITSGGGLTVAGGLSVEKDVFLGGFTNLYNTLDLNTNIITNVTAPSLDLDVANKWYVDDRFMRFTVGNVNGNFTQGQVIIATTGGNITGYSNFMYNATTLYLYSTEQATSLTNGGALYIAGGASIEKQLFVGGDAFFLGVVDVNNQKITSVAIPTTPYDAANKYYVDNRFDQFTIGNVSGNFTQGQVIIATTNGNITGFDNFLFDGAKLSLLSTTNAVGLTSGGVLSIAGGASILKELYLGGNVYLNETLISNVTAPSTGLDVANKWYVDNRFDQFTIGNVSGNFTQGQVIVASTLGNITGFDNFRFYDDTLSILSTKEATSLTSGGVLNVLGGATIQKSVYIGGPTLQIPIGDLASRPINPIPGSVRYNTETQQFEGFGAGNNWGSLGGVVDIAQTTKILASESPSTTDGNLYFYTVGSERVRINSAGNVGIGTTIPGATLDIAGNLRVQTGIDANSQIITNVTAPTVGLDVANKWYVDNRFDQFTIGNVSGNFTQGQIIVASTLGNITGFDNFRFYDDTLSIFATKDATSLTEGGVLNISGGVTIDKSLFVGGPALQIPQGDTATRPVNPVGGYIRYNTETQQFEGFGAGNNWGSLGGVVDIAQTTKILASESPSTTDGNLYFYTVGSERVRINSSGNVGIGTTAPGATLDIAGNLRVQTGIDANSQIITNVTAPTLGLDVANKWYVDNRFDQFTIGNVSGNFTQGQVIIATTNGNITGFDNFLYDGVKLSLFSTANASNLTSGGVLSIAGGATISKDVYIGGKLDVNLNNITSVQDPYQPYDAVNKRYVDTQIENIFTPGNGSFFQYASELDNNVTTPQNIPNFIVSPTAKAFVAKVHMSNDITCAVYTLKGMLTNNGWTISYSFIGGYNQYLAFYVGNSGQQTYIQYTNTDINYLTTIKYGFTDIIENAAGTLQENIPLSGSINSFQNISQLTFSSLNAIKLIIYISSDIDQQYGILIFEGLSKNGTWQYNTYSVGNVYDTIIFNITNNGIVQYINNSNSNDYTIRVVKRTIDNSIIAYTLASNSSTTIDVLGTILGSNTNTHFLISAYVYIPTDNLYSFYEIEGVYISNTWNLHSRFIGDNIGISFGVSSVNNVDYLSYTNPNNVNAYIRIINDNPYSASALSVSKGGTGTTYFNDYAVLRGNGSNAIYASDDFIYKHNSLILGSLSSIILVNTQDSNNLTSGTLVSYGGITVNKTVRVGEELIVNNVNMTPLIDDISSEQTFYASNNQIQPQDITGFIFSTQTKSFTAMVCITIMTITNSLDCLFDIKGLRKSSGWALYTSSVGDDVGITFDITGLGQIRYTSTDISDWVSNTMKFRAFTTSA